MCVALLANACDVAVDDRDSRNIRMPEAAQFGGILDCGTP
jgi:hypothetical protein